MKIWKKSLLSTNGDILKYLGVLLIMNLFTLRSLCIIGGEIANRDGIKLWKSDEECSQIKKYK